MSGCGKSRWQRQRPPLVKLAGTMRRAYSVTCGRWSCAGMEVVSNARGREMTKAEAERAARQMGWSKSANEGWLCPMHARRTNE